MTMIRRTVLAASAMVLGMASVAATASLPPVVQALLEAPAKRCDGFSSPVGISLRRDREPLCCGKSALTERTMWRPILVTRSTNNLKGTHFSG